MDSRLPPNKKKKKDKFRDHNGRLIIVCRERDIPEPDAKRRRRYETMVLVNQTNWPGK